MLGKREVKSSSKEPPQEGTRFSFKLSIEGGIPALQGNRFTLQPAPALDGGLSATKIASDKKKKVVDKPRPPKKEKEKDEKEKEEEKDEQVNVKDNEELEKRLKSQENVEIIDAAPGAEEEKMLGDALVPYSERKRLR